jgi:hypothetical protein
MKKFGFASIGIVVIALIYFFSIGSTQLIAEIKPQVQKEVEKLKIQGFDVETQEVSTDIQHYIITIDDPKKISSFLKSKGTEISHEDIAQFKGMKLAIDMQYLADSYSAVSLDIYPLTLPTILTSSTVNKKDKQPLSQLEKMLKEKTFLVHIDINKLLNGFKGYLKDINETFHDEKEIQFEINALTFIGKIEEDKVTHLTQDLENLKMAVVNDSSITLDNFSSLYSIKGKDKQEYHTEYKIAKLTFSSNKKRALNIEDIHVDSHANVDKNLSSFSIKTQVKSIDYKEKEKVTQVEKLNLEIKVDNLDMKALESLEDINPNEEEEVLAILQNLISKGVNFEIPNLSIEAITLQKQKMEGFTFNSMFNIDKSLDLSLLENNPMAAIDAINANLYLSLSSDIFALIAQQPQAMMALMLFQPKDVKGKKVYEVELKDTKLLINGMPMM